jgi:hypothetical protein
MVRTGRDRLWPWRVASSGLTAVFGWWGFPWGPVYTVRALHGNFTKRNRARLGDLLTLPTWDAGSGSFGAMLPKG